MPRQSCTACGEKIGVKQFYKALSYAVTCQRCGNRHEAARASRWTVAIAIAVAPILSIGIREVLHVPPAWAVPIVLLYITAVYALLPWLLRLKRPARHT